MESLVIVTYMYRVSHVVYCLRSCFPYLSFLFFFFNDTATTEIYTLSLHDALPISAYIDTRAGRIGLIAAATTGANNAARSEEHTSELQSLRHLVCRLLLEKKKHNDHDGHKDKLKAVTTNREPSPKMRVNTAIMLAQ